jgi:hypothetical protein
MCKLYNRYYKKLEAVCPELQLSKLYCCGAISASSLPVFVAPACPFSAPPIPCKQALTVAEGDVVPLSLSFTVPVSICWHSAFSVQCSCPVVSLVRLLWCGALMPCPLIVPIPVSVPILIAPLPPHPTRRGSWQWGWVGRQIVSKKVG